MALPTTGTISLLQVAAELGVTPPLSLNDSRTRNLAGKPAGNISLNDLRGKSAASIKITQSSQERFVRDDGWDQWYAMTDYFSVQAVGTTITSRTWTVIQGSYAYISSTTNSNNFEVTSAEYLYGGSAGPFVKVRCVAVTPAGTFTAESVL